MTNSDDSKTRPAWMLGTLAMESNHLTFTEFVGQDQWISRYWYTICFWILSWQEPYLKIYQILYLIILRNFHTYNAINFQTYNQVWFVMFTGLKKIPVPPRSTAMPLMIFVSDVGCGCPVRLIRTSIRLGDVTVGATSRSYSCVGLRWFSIFYHGKSPLNHHLANIFSNHRTSKSKYCSRKNTCPTWNVSVDMCLCFKSQHQF